MNKMENDKRVYPICKYCGNLIKDGKIWEKDVFGNGFHHVCYLKILEYYSPLSQRDILGDN